MKVQEYSGNSWAPVLNRAEQKLLDRAIGLLVEMTNEGFDRNWPHHEARIALINLRAVRDRAVLS